MVHLESRAPRPVLLQSVAHCIIKTDTFSSLRMHVEVINAQKHSSKITLNKKKMATIS